MLNPPQSEGDCAQLRDPSNDTRHVEGSGTEEQCESEEQEKKSRAENV